MVVPAQILAVVGTAVFAGAMLAIGLILGAFWRTLPPSDFLAWFQTHSHLIQRVIPVFVAPAIVGLVVATRLSWADVAARGWWIGALVCMAGILLLTVAYFLPLNARFMAGIPVADVPSALEGWLTLHWLRIGLGLATAVAGMVAVTR